MKALILFIFFNTSLSCLACFPVKVPLEERVKNASQIATGVVTGIYLQQFEAQLQQPGAERQLPEAYQLRVLVNENLKSQFETKVIEPVIANCGSGKGELREKVIVFLSDDYWYVTTYNDVMFQKIKQLMSQN